MSTDKIDSPTLLDRCVPTSQIFARRVRISRLRVSFGIWLLNFMIFKLVGVSISSQFALRRAFNDSIFLISLSANPSSLGEENERKTCNAIGQEVYWDRNIPGVRLGTPDPSQG